jgi:hypothetical protein
VGIDHSTGFGSYSGTGVKYSKGDGTFFVGRDGGQPLWLNRETSQGDLIGLAASGSTKARIGIDGDDFIVKTGTGGNTEQLRIKSDGRGLSQFTAKAWVNFDGTTNVGGNCSIEDSHNVSTVTDNGTGIYTVNFTNAMANSDYSASLTGGSKSGGAYSLAYNGNVYSTTAIKVRSYYENVGGWDVDTASIVIFGD